MIHAPTACLWFDGRVEEAAAFYVATFPGSRVVRTTRYGPAAAEASGRPEGDVLTVDLELNGAPFQLLNGGPLFSFDEAISFVVRCDTQTEIDTLWEGLVVDGGAHSRCGWLKDRFGVSWQIVPANMDTFFDTSTPEQLERVMVAVMGMSKLEMAALERAAAG